MKKRSILAMILLTIITLGIYGLYWYISFQVQLKKETGDGFGGWGHFFMSLITFGIYSIYWNYAAGKRLAKLGAEDHSIIYLILALIGFSWLNALLMQHQANKL